MFHSADMPDLFDSPEAQLVDQVAMIVDYAAFLPATSGPAWSRDWRRRRARDKARQILALPALARRPGAD